MKKILCDACEHEVTPAYGMCPICDKLLDPTQAHVPFPEPRSESQDSQD